MNQAKTAILVDSGCDISPHLVEQYGFKVVRLKIIYHDRIFNDGLDIPGEYVYEHFKEEIPKTSTPNVYEVEEMIDEIRKEGYEKILGITISSGLSGTYNTIATALHNATDLRTFCFDTKNISFAAGIYAIYAARRFEEGATFEEVCQELQDKIDDSHLGYYMDTLDYLRAGGRITPSVAIVGKILNLKPIIACNKEGVYYTIAKIRGAKKGVQKLIDLIAPESIKGKKFWIYCKHGGGKETCDKAIAQLKERFPDAEWIVAGDQITASLAIHTGPGLLGLGVFALEPNLYPSKNLKDEVTGAIESANDMKDAVIEKANEMKEAVSDFTKKAGEYKDKAAEMAEEYKEKAQEVVDKVKEKIGK